MSTFIKKAECFEITMHISYTKIAKQVYKSLFLSFFLHLIICKTLCYTQLKPWRMDIQLNANQFKTLMHCWISDLSERFEKPEKPEEI